LNSEGIPFAWKKSIAIGFFTLAFAFLVYLGVLTARRSLKTLDELNYVEGKITDTRIIKHKYRTRRRIVLKNVLVLGVDGTSEKFGFTEDSEAYKRLFGFREIGKPAKIYYDSNGKRIEQGVTLHIYDLKIGNYQVVRMGDSSRWNPILSVIFFAGALLTVIVAVSAFKSREQIQMEDSEGLLESDEVSNEQGRL
jgi:hypothetical protein